MFVFWRAMQNKALRLRHRDVSLRDIIAAFVLQTQ